jgi:AAA domain
MDTYNPDLTVGKLRVLPPRAKLNGAAPAPTEPLPYLDMSSWDVNPAPDREWAVENRIPMYQPHLTTGHGAIGKSLLELTRAVAHVLGKPWLGMAVRQGPVIYLGAEDEADSCIAG